MEKEAPENMKSTSQLNLQLISPEYFMFERQPELYLMRIIDQNNPWPHIPQSKLLNFLENISSLYNPVSYHNLTHAFDVMTSFDQYLIRYGWMQKLSITQSKRIFMLIAAYAHDSGHQGLTNAYYKNSNHPLSINTVSPLQNMHVGNLQKMLREYQLEIPRDILQQLTEMILKTDNFYHNWLLQQFQSLYGLTLEELRSPKNALTMSCILLHAADLNNAAKDIQLSMRWTNYLYIQFEKQAVLEQSLSLPVSFIKPSNGIEYIDSNLSFLDHMIVPLFRGITLLESAFTDIYQKILKNRQHLATLKQKGKEQTVIQ